jgi:hypothetical protein
MPRSVLALALVAASLPAAAHFTLERSSLPAGSLEVVVFRLGHGCEGSPTTALRIELPAGLLAVHPRAKAGWRIEIEPAADGRRGQPRAITWRGGPLPSDEFDEFAVMMKLPSTPGRLVFPALQTCEEGSERWGDVAPKPGMPAGEHPAAVLDVVVPSDFVPAQQRP